MKGYAGKFILMLVMMGIFSILYIATDVAYDSVYTWGSTRITDADSAETLALLNIMWIWFPVAVLFSYVVYSIRKPQEEATF